VQALTRKKVDSVFQIVDNILKQVFGEKSTLLIYRYLETHYSLPKHEIGVKIDVFAEGLENFLSSGAPLIERKILQDIYSRQGIMRTIEIDDVDEEFDFATQVRFAIAIQNA